MDRNAVARQMLGIMEAGSIVDILLKKYEKSSWYSCKTNE